MDDENKPIICVDLDGVLNSFDGWKGADFFHPPRPGAREFLQNSTPRDTAWWSSRCGGARMWKAGWLNTVSPSMSRW